MLFVNLNSRVENQLHDRFNTIDRSFRAIATMKGSSSKRRYFSCGGIEGRISNFRGPVTAHFILFLFDVSLKIHSIILG